MDLPMLPTPTRRSARLSWRHPHAGPAETPPPIPRRAEAHRRAAGRASAPRVIPALIPVLLVAVLAFGAVLLALVVLPLLAGATSG